MRRAGRTLNLALLFKDGMFEYGDVARCHDSDATAAASC